MIDLLLTIVITVLFCLGWNIITSEGNLLYFIKKPFSEMLNSLEMNEELYLRVRKKVIKKRINILKIKTFLAKPFVLCITCFGSLWGVVIFVTLNGISIKQLPLLIINCIASSFVQTYIWVKYTKLNE